jgi:hypothetical protein
MRYRLRTLLIVLAIGPPLLAAVVLAPFITRYFAGILLAAFVMFLCALLATVGIRAIIGLWDR